MKPADRPRVYLNSAVRQHRSRFPGLVLRKDSPRSAKASAPICQMLNWYLIAFMLFN